MGWAEKKSGILSQSHFAAGGPTILDDFRRGGLTTGEDLLRHYESGHLEMGGFNKGLRNAEIEGVPAARRSGGRV